jgi:hypothetical protein
MTRRTMFFIHVRAPQPTAAQEAYGTPMWSNLKLLWHQIRLRVIIDAVRLMSDDLLMQENSTIQMN